MSLRWLVLAALVSSGASCTTAKSTTDSEAGDGRAKSTTDSEAGEVRAKSTADSETGEARAKSTTDSETGEARAKSTAASETIAVWIDVDTAAGLPNRDVDDAMALIQAFNSPELSIRGVSSVFGNVPLEAGHKITEEIYRRFGPSGLRVHMGAPQPGLHPTRASEALAAALRTERLSILALGPVTNIAAALTNHPDIADRIDELVIVAGRRPGQRFITGNKSARAHRDFNFEKDPEAMKVVLRSKVPITLTPWELSSKVWIDRKEIAVWESGSAASKWLAHRSESWITLWKERFGLERFNPFDTLAVARLVRPDLIQCSDAFAVIERKMDDTPDPADIGAPRSMKPFLHVTEDRISSHPVRYCFDVKDAFNSDLRGRLTR